MTANYDPNNVFAKILRGEMPAHRIYEDEETFAFMDIMPRGDGHCLVIPKVPSRNILDIDTDSLAAVYRTVQKLSRAVVKAFGAEEREAGRFRQALVSLYRTNMRVVRALSVMPPAMELLGGIGMAGALWYGSQQIAAGRLTPGEFTTFLAAMLMMWWVERR